MIQVGRPSQAVGARRARGSHKRRWSRGAPKSERARRRPQVESQRGRGLLTTLRKKVAKVSASVVTHGRAVTLRLASVAVARDWLRGLLRLIDLLGSGPASLWIEAVDSDAEMTKRLRLECEKCGQMIFRTPEDREDWGLGGLLRRILFPRPWCGGMMSTYPTSRWSV